MRARRQQRHESVVRGVQIAARPVFPVERNRNAFAAAQIIKIDKLDRRRQEFCIVGKRRRRVEPRIIRRPCQNIRINPALREDLFFRAIGKVVQHGDGRHLLVKLVMQAARVNRHRVFPILGYAPPFDPIGVVGQPRDFFVLHRYFEQAYRSLVAGIIYDFRIVFLLFLRLLIRAGIFLGAENERVFVQPLRLAWRTLQFGQRISLSAMRINQPDLRRGGIRLRSRPWARTQKSNPLPIW